MIRYCSTVLNGNNRLYSKNISQSGFALPVAVGMGLVMMIVAASMIGRAQNDRTITNSQRETSRALSTAEAGVIRVQLFLDRHKFLATKDLSKWSDTLNNLSPVQASCRLIDSVVSRQQIELFKNNSWINLDSSNLNKGRYKIIDYQYRDGFGKLTVSGAIDVYNTTQNSSKSTLTVEIPIGNEAANIAPPALWANTFNLNLNQKVTGQIQAAACPQLPNIDPDGIVGVDGSNISSGQIIADPFTPIPAPKIAPANATPLSAITTTIKLPRLKSIDTPDAKGEYHYLVDIDDSTSGYSIKLTDLDRIEIDVKAGQKVNLYLKGNIDLAGSQTLNVNPLHPNLRIYGGDRTLKFRIKDNASITAFIHTPFADAIITTSSTPNLNKNITGGLWVKSWDSATSPAEIPIIQAGNWSDFGISKLEQPAQISPVSSWQRVGN